jgi:release factor glutamine methyltransferase
MDETVAAALNESCLTIAQALREGGRLLAEGGIDGALLDAEVLLCHALEVGREYLYSHSEAPLAPPAAVRYRESIRRRRLREPVAYITGRKEFWSLDLVVTPDVLIPRPETELLVEVCLKLAREMEQGAGSQEPELGGRRPDVRNPNPEGSAPCSMLFAPCALRVLELGTGSGAIAISLAHELQGAEIVATDASAASLQVAQKNAARFAMAGRIEFLQGNLFGAVPTHRRFDFILANPPYVRSTELETLPPEVRCWEPLMALNGGEDGLNCYRDIAAKAHWYLAEGGCILLEIGSDMTADVSRLFNETNRYTAPSIYQDYGDRNRVFATSKLSRFTVTCPGYG